MKQLKVRLQLTLGRMRTKQRTQQREIERELDAKEEQEEDEEDDGDEEGDGDGEDKEGGRGRQRRQNPPSYCRVCKLVFHQNRDDHNASEMHHLISKFLSPTCEICDTQFFSPMAYERHIGSLAHIKVRERRASPSS